MRQTQQKLCLSSATTLQRPLMMAMEAGLDGNDLSEAADDGLGGGTRCHGTHVPTLRRGL